MRVLKEEAGNLPLFEDSTVLGIWFNQNNKAAVGEFCSLPHLAAKHFCVQ